MQLMARLSGLVALISLFGLKPVMALDAESNLAKKAQNPVENMISVPFNSAMNYDYGPRHNSQYNLNLKPVIPFQLTHSLNLITRTIIPILHQPDLLDPQNGYINGFGDFNPTFFLSPTQPSHIIWGAGPDIVFPTATNKQLGQGKYSIGPSAVVLTMPGHWVLGVLASNVWSIAGQSNRANVNQFTLQYFVNYNFDHGWYVTTQPIITANWMANSDERWLIPVGGGMGRVFHIGKQAINASIQAYDNIKKPKTIGPGWQAQLNISLLFPK